MAMPVMNTPLSGWKIFWPHSGNTGAFACVSIFSCIRRAAESAKFAGDRFTVFSEDLSDDEEDDGFEGFGTEEIALP